MQSNVLTREITGTKFEFDLVLALHVLKEQRKCIAINYHNNIIYIIVELAGIYLPGLSYCTLAEKPSFYSVLSLPIVTN